MAVSAAFALALAAARVGDATLSADDDAGDANADDDGGGGDDDGRDLRTIIIPARLTLTELRRAFLSAASALPPIFVRM
eukprot:760611-Pleurochrysis_carterae.AAC.1